MNLQRRREGFAHGAGLRHRPEAWSSLRFQVFSLREHIPSAEPTGRPSNVRASARASHPSPDASGRDQTRAG